MSKPTVKDLQAKAHELIDKHEMYAAMCCDNGDKEQAEDHIQIARVLRLCVTIHESTMAENASLTSQLTTVKGEVEGLQRLLKIWYDDLQESAMGRGIAEELGIEKVLSSPAGEYVGRGSIGNIHLLIRSALIGVESLDQAYPVPDIERMLKQADEILAASKQGKEGEG